VIIIRVGIFQVLGNFEYENVRYIIEDKAYSHSFSAIAIKEWLLDSGIKADVFMLIPESLAESIGEDPAHLIENREEFEKAAKEKTGVDAEFRIIPSVGKYNRLEFAGSAENTAIDIFRVACNEELDVVIGDVSTGLNIYSVILVEALRRYATYKKLEDLLQQSRDFEMKLAFIPPILRKRKEAKIEEVNVEMQNVNVKAIFDTPGTNVSRLCTRGTDNREINTNFGGKLKILKDIVGNVKIAVNAVKMNTPLAFYHKEVINFDYDVEGAERTLWDVIDFALKPRFDGSNKIWRLLLHGNNVFNTFFSIAMAKSFQEFVKTLPEVAEAEELIRVFSDLYEKVGVEANVRFLQRDIDGLRENVPDGFRGCYAECFDGSGGSKDEKRNFFAHSGFLREITIVERQGDKIFVRWDENSLKKVRNWLKDPK